MTRFIVTSQCDSFPITNPPPSSAKQHTHLQLVDGVLGGVGAVQLFHQR